MVPVQCVWRVPASGPGDAAPLWREVSQPLPSHRGLSAKKEMGLKYSNGKPGEHLGSCSEEKLLN